MGPGNVVHASLWDLLHPYALLGGLVTLTLFTAHGAMFLTLRTTEELVQRSRAVARRLAPLATVLMAAFLIWTASDQSSGGTKWAAQIFAIAAVACAAAASCRRDAGA